MSDDAAGFTHYVGGNKSAYDFIREFLNKASGEDIKPLAEKVKRWLTVLNQVKEQKNKEKFYEKHKDLCLIFEVCPPAATGQPNYEDLHLAEKNEVKNSYFSRPDSSGNRKFRMPPYNLSKQKRLFVMQWFNKGVNDLRDAIKKNVTLFD